MAGTERARALVAKVVVNASLDALKLARDIVETYSRAEGLSEPAERLLNLARCYCELYDETRLAEDTGRP